MKTIATIVCAVGLLIAAGWLLTANDLALYKYFGPRYEGVRRQVFENTRSFNQGMIQELENMQFQYEATSDPAAKTALASIILHRASGYNMDDSDVPDSLRTFVDRLRRNQEAAR